MLAYLNLASLFPKPNTASGLVSGRPCESKHGLPGTKAASANAQPGQLPSEFRYSSYKRVIAATRNRTVDPPRKASCTADSTREAAAGMRWNPAC
jgi:hypothetical protein